MEMSAWKNWQKQVKLLKKNLEMFDAIDESIWDDLATEQQEDMTRWARKIANLINSTARDYILWGDEDE